MRASFTIPAMLAKLRQRARVKARSKVEAVIGEDILTINGLRGYNGYSCFVGIFISQEDYKFEMEGLSVDKLFTLGAFGECPTSRLPLLRRSQLIHDFVNPRTWADELDKLERDSLWQEQYLKDNPPNKREEDKIDINKRRGQRARRTLKNEI